MTAGARHGWFRVRDSPVAPFGIAPAAILIAVNLVDKIESSILAGTLPLLQAEWGFSDTLAGSIPTASAIAGFLVILPGGYLADRLRRTWVLAAIVVSWSFVSVASALAGSFGVFFATRVVLGAADNIDNPAASSLLADYYGPRARARTFGLQRISLVVGIGLGALIGGGIGELFGWRAAYLVAAVPGLLVGLSCLALPEPPRGAMDRYTAARSSGDDHERARRHLEEKSPETPASSGGSFLRDVAAAARIPTIRLFFPGLAAAFMGLSGVSYWLPTFIGRIHEVGEARAGAVTAGILLIGGLSGALVGGVLGDRWHGVRRGGRITLTGIGVAGGTLTIALATGVSSLAPQAVMFLAAIFLLGIAIPNFSAVTADVLPSSRRGAGFALFQLVAAASISSGPLALGAISDATGSLRVAFLGLLPLALLGSAMLLRARKHVDDDCQRVLGGEVV